jgi:hypothetical protein
MNTSTSHLSPWKRNLAIIAIGILALGGFGFLYSVLAGESHGWSAWLRPFGPWCCALFAYSMLVNAHKNDRIPLGPAFLRQKR